VSFNVLTIRTGAETGDDALYPALSEPDQPALIALDSYDGGNIVSFVATAVRVLEVAATARSLIKLREVRIDVYITDGRIALACEKYDKGGGWTGFGVGGVLVAATANAVSKARAASRSRGKVLVGQVRYPWVKAVGATSKTGFATNEAIRIEYAEKSGGSVVRKMLELTLPKNVDATLVAQDIARRVASYRLANTPDLKPENRASFAALSQGPALLQPEPKKFAFYQMPTFFYAGAGTAYPKKQGVPAAQTSSAAEPGSAGPVRPGPVSPGSMAPPPAQVPSPPGPGPAGRHAAPVPAVIFCTQCGTRNNAGDNFCGQCGSPLKKPAATQIS
jgi:zinc-ribbon domain